VIIRDGTSYGVQVTKAMAKKIAELADVDGCDFSSGRLSRRFTV